MSEGIFASNAAFRRAFEQGLVELLEHEALGPFILVSANATYDPEVYAATEARLRQLYALLSAEYRTALAEGKPIHAVEEDLLVFLKIHAVGFDALNKTERREAGMWQLQFNHLRSFRPKRITQSVPEGIARPFDRGGFHFNKPFMQKEAFWEGELGGRRVSLYYNKYPFADLHGLLVPEREAERPQLLEEAEHHYVWQLAATLGESLEGVGFGYNAYGAFASVNHLHFQMFVQPTGLPVDHGHWHHNGGRHAYPAACRRFDSAEQAWQAIAALHAEAVPYNLLYLPGRLYLFARRKQGSYEQPAWTSGFTWHELAGGIITFNRQDYATLEAESIEEELARLRPD